MVSFAALTKTPCNMEYIIWCIAAAICAAALTYFAMKAKTAALNTALDLKDNSCNNLAADNRRLEETNARLADENRQLSAENLTMKREIELTREQAEKESEERRLHFDEQLKLVREQLQNASQELLKQRSHELSAQNAQQMDAIITPLKDTIKEMKASMDISRDMHNKNTASLEKAIEEVMKRTREVGEEADKLAHALRNENKTQGNWGELILDELLTSYGLVEGIHYEKQAILRDAGGKALRNEETGQRMIPDTILHYPDGKDAIIDSKVSLTAFLDYQNAEDDAKRAEALSRHLKSLRQHVQELARKDYAAYIKAPRQALNYVIMFVPNEGALQLALYSEPSLWRDAFEKGVFITGEQNLAAALRIIQIAWTQVQQARNQEQIFDTARQLLDRVADFLHYFDEVGEKLHDASAMFTKASDKLKDGRQSVVGASNKLIKLGAKPGPKKVIPEENEPLELPDMNADGANVPVQSTEDEA